MSDPNYLVCKDQEKTLREKYMGKWVAFVDGRFAIAEEDKNTLQNRKPLFAKLETMNLPTSMGH